MGKRGTYKRSISAAGPVEVLRVVVDPETGEQRREAVRVESAQRGAYYQPNKGGLGTARVRSEGGRPIEGRRRR